MKNILITVLCDLNFPQLRFTREIHTCDSRGSFDLRHSAVQLRHTTYRPPPSSISNIICLLKIRPSLVSEGDSRVMSVVTKYHKNPPVCWSVSDIVTGRLINTSSQSSMSTIQVALYHSLSAMPLLNLFSDSSPVSEQPILELEKSVPRWCHLYSNQVQGENSKLHHITL